MMARGFAYFWLSAMCAWLVAQTASATERGEYDEPRIETARNARGEPTEVLRYYYRGGLAIDLAELSFAQRKMLRSTFGADADAPRRAYLECPAAPDGVIEMWGCKPVDEGFSSGRETLLFTRLIRLLDISLPMVPEISPARAHTGPRRWVQFDLEIVAGPADPELPESPLVEQSEILGLDGARAEIVYPARALREEAYGRLVALCQVQADLSVACTQESFEPVEHAAYFAGIAPNVLLAGRVGATLASGGSSVGARFRFAVNFAIDGR